MGGFGGIFRLHVDAWVSLCGTSHLCREGTRSRTTHWTPAPQQPRRHGAETGAHPGSQKAEPPGRTMSFSVRTPGAVDGKQLRLEAKTQAPQHSTLHSPKAGNLQPSSTFPHDMVLWLR